MKTIKPFVYMATSLTHVPEELRPNIAALADYLAKHTHFLKWAFDPATWTPRKVDNIFAFDTAMVGFADFVAGVYWSSAGSDGRGAELYKRVRDMGNKGIVIYVQNGVRVTPFITDMADKFHVLIQVFDTVDELGMMILNHACGSLQEELWPVGHHSRRQALDALCAGFYERLVSYEATADLKRLVESGENEKTSECMLV